MGNDYYSLWFESSDDEWYRQQIKKLSVKYGEMLFNPHITALPKITGDKTRIIADTLKLRDLINSPFSFHFYKYAYGKTLTQCIYAVVKEGKETKRINEKTFSVFGMTNQLFHFSFLYSNIAEQERVKIVKELGEINRYFLINKLVVISRTERRGVPEWKEIFSCDLTTASPLG